MVEAQICLRSISTAASFPLWKCTSRIVAIYLSKNAVCQGNYLPAFALITKASMSMRGRAFCNRGRVPRHCPARPTSRDARISRLRLLSQLRGPYVWVLTFPLNLPATEGAAVTRIRAVIFRETRCFVQEPILACAGGGL